MKNDGLFYKKIFIKTSKIWLFPSVTPPLLLKRGQTLIEAAVAIAVALVLISSVVALINATNRRATLNRQANQASKLAQEGMEIVRNMRDINSRFVMDGRKLVGAAHVPCTIAAACTFSDLYTDDQIDPTYCLRSVGLQWLLLPTSSACETNLLGLGTLFTRRVQITDGSLGGAAACTGSDLDYLNSKMVTVTVSWTSSIGSQSKRVASCLTRWNY